MPRFFVAGTQVADGRCVIGYPDAHHLARSLRCVAGDVVSVADDAGTEYSIRVDTVTPDRVEGDVITRRAVETEPKLRVHVVQALARQGMDEAIEAMTQVGAAAIWPVVTDRSVARPDGTRITKRLTRWRLIAGENAGLAFRGAPPIVAELGDLAGTLAALPPHTRLVACSIGPNAVALHGLVADPGRPIAICVGPEGGWSPADLAILSGAGAEHVHLGPRILRSRLAGAIACAILLANAGDCSTPAAPLGCDLA